MGCHDLLNSFSSNIKWGLFRLNPILRKIQHRPVASDDDGDDDITDNERKSCESYYFYWSMRTDGTQSRIY